MRGSRPSGAVNSLLERREDRRGGEEESRHTAPEAGEQPQRRRALGTRARGPGADRRHRRDPRRHAGRVRRRRPDVDAIITSWGMRIDQQVIDAPEAVRRDRRRQRRRGHGGRRGRHRGRDRGHQRPRRLHRGGRRPRDDAAAQRGADDAVDDAHGPRRRVVPGPPHPQPSRPPARPDARASSRSATWRGARPAGPRPSACG